MTLPTPRALFEYYRRIPTTDLYFRHPVRHLRETGHALPRIRHLRHNVYMVGRTGVISRYATLADLALLQKQPIRQIIYIADDDFAAGAADPALPETYRARLAAFTAECWPSLRDAADIVLVSSPLLAEVYGAKACLIPPVWHRPPAPPGHFNNPRRFDIAHLGSGSHRADLAPLAPALATLLTANPTVRLTLFSGADVPPGLNGHRQVRSRRPLPWWAFKRVLPRMRFHLAIYPLRDSPFNAARSANKLFEHSLVGAASLLSPNLALRDAAGAGLETLLVGGGADEWRDRIAADIADPATCRDRAIKTRAHILHSDPAGEAARQWLAILAGET